MEKKTPNFPVGIDNFEKIRKNNFYYVDKTELIIELLNHWSEVTLFTRPRRFGKTLNMSMLKSFFDMDSDKSIFDGLKIAKETELCKQYMGKYPVIFLSMKTIYAEDFETASALMIRLVREATKRYESVLEDSPALTRSDRADFKELLDVNMPKHVLYGSLKTLSMLLEKHYGQKIIVLIDEYDVPLAKAYEQGYYDQMIILIRNLFEQLLKTNDSLQFAVLTGCMRISKESIFTGLNNLEVRSISEEEYEEYFGFTDNEVRDMLACCNASSRYDVVKEWYDGYHFGNTDIYCPWDVTNYCKSLARDPDADPESYWLNSSSNNIVRQLIQRSGNAAVRGEIESLINGEYVEKQLCQDLTYPEMYSSIENLWSVLYTTGYLTYQGKRKGNSLRLVIPNQEVHNIFTEQILELFTQDIQKDGETLKRFCHALQTADVQTVERCLSDYLKKTISIRDTAVKTSLKENFYHGILLGILGLKESWTVTSNRESGSGYSDILIRDFDHRLAMVIEIKYAQGGNLEAACNHALRQVEEKHYTDDLCRENFETILRYGMAFHRKECRVVLAEEP